VTAGGAGEPRQGGILREGYDYTFSRCDPATGAHVDPAWCAVYETATVADSTGVLGPSLATEWRQSPDGTEWRFRIRPGARYHSGAPCDAPAVAATFAFHADPVASPLNSGFWHVVDTVRADGDEVVVTLHHPSVGFPSLLRSWHAAVHNQASREAAGDDYGWTSADGTGPFRLTRLDPAELQEVERWADYPGTGVAWLDNRGPADLDGIQWIPLPDEEQRAPALEEGVVDCVQNPSLLHLDRLQANPDLRVVTFQQSSLVYLALDHETTRLGFDDVRVRRAISCAIDRAEIVERDLAGHGWPAYGPVPSASGWYEPGVEKLVGYAPEESSALLDAAGLTPDSEGIRLRFRVLVLEDATVRRAAASVQELLRPVGVEIELCPVSGFADFYGALGDHPEAFLSKWFWPDPVDAIVLFVSSWSHAGPNWQRASIPALDAACRAWMEAPDVPAQEAAASEIQLLSAEHLPLIPLFSPAAAWTHHTRVRGWAPTPTNLYPLYNDVWLAE
jgi:peptide/nickel transport system substrate-binding protein